MDSINLIKARERIIEPVPAEFREIFVRLVKPLAPFEAVGVPKKRFGGPLDGGYVMLDDFEGIAGVYSMGIGREISWDLAMAQLRLPVFQFDHSIDKLPYFHPLFHFEKKRIGARANAADGTESIDSIVRRHGHENKDLILKIDVELAEWDILAKIDPEVLRNFRQIAIEIHGFTMLLPDKGWIERATRAIGNLTRFHKVVHVHANTTSRLFCSDNLVIPDMLEFTLAREDAYSLRESYEFFPGPLDRPNDPLCRDISLGTFRYE